MFFKDVLLLTKGKQSREATDYINWIQPAVVVSMPGKILFNQHCKTKYFVKGNKHDAGEDSCFQIYTRFEFLIRAANYSHQKSRREQIFTFHRTDKPSTLVYFSMTLIFYENGPLPLQPLPYCLQNCPTLWMPMPASHVHQRDDKMQKEKKKPTKEPSSCQPAASIDSIRQCKNSGV